MIASGSSNSSRINSVFYAESYHPIQAGSIDGTDILPHDNAIYRAHLCSSARLYDSLGDPKVIGDPYCTLFVARLSPLTTEDSLTKAMAKYGSVKNLRLVRHIVTGASRGYAFVEYETEREMRRAFEDAHHSIIDDSEIIVDYNRQQLMPGWIPRRLGGGLGGKKESGQLRFGGRERPFRAPLRPIPWDDLKRLGIPPPPEGRYMPRFEVPSPPQRKRSSVDREDNSHRSRKHSEHPHRHEKRSTSRDRTSYERSSVDMEDSSHMSHKHSEHSHRHEKRSASRDHPSYERNSVVMEDSSHRSQKRSEHSSHRSHKHSEHSHSHEKSSTGRDRPSYKRSSVDREDGSHRSDMSSEHSHRREKRSASRDRRSYEGSSVDREEKSRKRRKHSNRNERSPDQ